MSTETVRLIRDGEKCVCVGAGGGGGGEAEREIKYLSLHCHHQNDICIKIGSRWEPFQINVSVGSDGQLKVTRQCPQTTTFLKRKECRTVVSNRSPSAYQPNALPLGQTGSQSASALLSLQKSVVVCGHCLVIIVKLSLTVNETLKWLSSLPRLMQESF